MPGVVREELRCEGVGAATGQPCRNAATHVWQGGAYCRWHGDPRRRKAAVQAHGRFRWTDDRLERLYQCLEQGMGYDRIAVELECSEHAAWEARKRYGLPSRKRLTLTAHDVARLLGKRCSKSVNRWIADGWLKARRGYHRGANRVLLVSWKDLERFVANERYWVTWDPARVTHPELIRAARRPGWARFLTHAEVAERCCVVRGTVNSWIQKGWLKAVRYGNWFVREDWLAEFEGRWFYGQRGAFVEAAA